MTANAGLPTEYRSGAHRTLALDSHGTLLWVGIGTIPSVASAAAVHPTSPPSSGTHLSTKLCWEISGEFGGTMGLYLVPGSAVFPVSYPAVSGKSERIAKNYFLDVINASLNLDFLKKGLAGGQTLRRLQFFCLSPPAVRP